ncbi:MAG: anaerobic ribonucleoside-triphosphate reductase activating protein [Syntrophales bacterium LBB04]|nr:anaerobic ribonucleoside-triphosphate reductase activating protein [Syntrophales bacterium LBB04]
MKIGSLQKVSLIDYPGKIGAIVFTQGCNFRCPYCHNPELVLPSLSGECIPEEFIFSYLDKRKGKLEAVTITGGEPSLQDDLPRFAQDIKAAGYMVKVDTNGSRPDVLEELLKNRLVDYIAMDIKAPLKKYNAITNTPDSDKTIGHSIKLIMDSGIDYEFRTTIVNTQLTSADILAIGKMIKNAPLYALQRYRNAKPLDRSFLNKSSFTQEEFDALKIKLEKTIGRVMIR